MMKHVLLGAALLALSAVAVAQSLAPVESSGIGLSTVFIAAGVALVVGGLVGHQIGKDPAGVRAAEQAALTTARNEFAQLAGAWKGALSRAHDIIERQATSMAAPAAPLAEPAKPAESVASGGAAPPVIVSGPVAPWAIGTSYTTLGAFLSDIRRPDFARQVRLDGEPVWNVAGPDPVDFYSTTGGGVAQKAA